MEIDQTNSETVKVELNQLSDQASRSETGSRNEKLLPHSVKNWKEYLGESLLIVFSVLLALFLTEYINHVHERNHTEELLNNIIVELKSNRQAILEMYDYNIKVLKNIDSAMSDPNIGDKLLTKDEFNLELLAPQGVLYRYFNNEAWTVAKNDDIFSKIDLETMTALMKIYEDQDRINKVESEVARILFDRASRDPKQVHLTLTLIKGIYHGWAVDRVPTLLSRIDNAIKKWDMNNWKK
jgi:hypothetical protein